MYIHIVSYIEIIILLQFIYMHWSIINGMELYILDVFFQVT